MAALEPDPEPHTTPPGLEACVAAVAYSGRAADWIARFKYPAPGLSGLDGSPGAVLRCLALRAGERALQRGPAPEQVIPVPLHPRRLRARGFNPAALLARELARRVGARCTPTALARVRDTPSQTGLDRRARRRNVAGAFDCPGRVTKEPWLVDDVVTTGATLAECAKLLRRHGARRVVAVCVARTPAEDGSAS